MSRDGVRESNVLLATTQDVQRRTAADMILNESAQLLELRGPAEVLSEACTPQLSLAPTRLTLGSRPAGRVSRRRTG